MEKKEKSYNRQSMFFWGKMVMVMFCMIFCSYAQKDSDSNETAAKENAEQYPFHCGDAVGITVFPDTVSFLT
ncbi:MAG: hypothetical protein WBM07_15810, partial [Chitinivibrionales bacterium]